MKPIPLARIECRPAGAPLSQAHLRQRRAELLAKLQAWLDPRCTVTLRKNVLFIGIRAKLSPQEKQWKAAGVLRVMEPD